MKDNRAVKTEVFMLASEGLRLRVLLAVPDPFSGPLPSVQIHHGGGGYEPVYEEMAMGLAQSGMVGITLIHRGYPGSEGQMQYGKGEIRDIQNLTEMLVKRPFIDKTRMGIMGYSRGGHHAILAIEQLGCFAAGALWSAPVDMVALVRAVPWVASIIGGSFEEIPHEYHARSSIHFVSEINCPLLILHGEQDEVVSVSHALRLAQTLKANQKYFEMKLFPDESHNWSIGAFENNWQITQDFFNRHLKHAR